MYFTIPVVLAILLTVGCSSSNDNAAVPPDDGPVAGTDTGTDTDTTDPVTDIFAPSDTDLVLDSDLYQEDGYGTANVIRVDVRTETTAGICTADDLSGCTLADVLADTDKNDDLKVDIPIHFQSSDFPDDGTLSNAEMRLRGGGSRFAPQKSFRIKLDSKEILWRGERYLQINKHPFESSRIRNKLAFDMMSVVPHLPSMRTQFVNLWIDDGAGAEDHGLYTHIERPNDHYLEKRGFNDKGNLYKAEDFRFDESDLLDVAVDEDGKPLDEDRFESSLEIEEGKDHRALVAMLTALHDPERSFDSVLDQYFNRNNVLSWMAVNILLNQADATRHNYLLYNPTGTEIFYFLPWDYDAAMGKWEEPPNSHDSDALRQRTEYGYAVGSKNDFTSRYYRLPGIHERIQEAVSHIHQSYITDELISEKATLYASLAAPFELQAPDSDYNPYYRESSAVQLAMYPGLNEQALANSFSIPMPPTLLEPALDGSSWQFSWAPAYDVTGHTVSYDLQISSSLEFSADDIVAQYTGIADAEDSVTQEVDASLLQSGDYYVRLTARADNEPERFWQVAENRIDRDGVRHFGVMAFSVP